MWEQIFSRRCSQITQLGRAYSSTSNSRTAMLLQELLSSRETHSCSAANSQFRNAAASPKCEVCTAIRVTSRDFEDARDYSTQSAKVDFPVPRLGQWITVEARGFRGAASCRAVPQGDSASNALVVTKRSSIGVPFQNVPTVHSSRANCATRATDSTGRDCSANA